MLARLTALRPNRTLLMWAILAVLVLWGIGQFDFVGALDQIASVSPIKFLIVALISMLHIAIVASRWWLICRSFGYEVGFRDALLINTHGSFLQNFTPGGVALDVVRVLGHKKAGIDRWGLLFMTVFDKGLLALVTLIVAASVLQVRYLEWPAQFVVLIAVGAALAILSVGLAGCRVLVPGSRMKIPKVPLPMQIGMLVLATTTIFEFALIYYLIVSFLMDLSIGFGSAMLFPVSVLVSSIPITPGGFGVREIVSVLTLEGTSGLDKESLIVTSTLFGLVFVVGTAVASLAALLSAQISK